MNGKTIFTPTEARQDFFNLLKQAEKGREIIIKTKEAVFRLKLEEIEDKSVKAKLAALEKLSKMNIKSLPIREMKKIYSSVHEIRLPK